MIDDRPYRVEYSKSGRATCRVCHKLIAKDVLRFAVVVQNPYHDSKIHEWHHADCYFQDHCPKTTGDIVNFDNVRWEDQEYIKKKIEKRGAPETEASVDTASTTCSGGGRKRSMEAATASDNADFKVEYAKSDLLECRGCSKTIIEGEIRLSKKDTKSEDCPSGGFGHWYHVECFTKLRSELQFFDDGISIPGADTLSSEDQDVLKKALPKIEVEDAPPQPKKIKPDPEDDEEEKNLKAQQEKLFAVRDKLALLKKDELVEMLEDNDLRAPVGQNEILDALTDALLFGALEPCPNCRNGRFEFKSGTGYQCTGTKSSWSLCENVTQDPKRKVFAIPEDLKEKHDFLKNFEPKVQRRLLKITAPSTSSARTKEDSTDGPEMENKPKPLKNFMFVLAGFPKDKSKKLTDEISALGGTVKYKVRKYTTAVISTPAEFEKSSSIIEEARNMNVHVVSEDIVEKAKKFVKAPSRIIKENSIADWGGTDLLRDINAVATGYAPRDASDYVKPSNGKQKLLVKGGGTVDPRSGLVGVAHVYQRGKDKFTISLAKVDIQMKQNGYYKMQILEHDKEEKYWLFRTWGRTATTIGRDKCDEMTLDECINKFESLFRERTENGWWARAECFKEPNKWYPIPDNDDNSLVNLLNWDTESKLKKPLQDLMRLIFDEELMRKAMLEYEIDTDAMPLGKISRKQIKEANLVLSELWELVKSGVQDRNKFIEASNRFYTLIPHNFGVDGLHIIKTEKEIQMKSEMLRSLSQIEIAYSMINNEQGADQNPLDAHYEQLNTDIDALDHESDEFKLIEKYVKNTHADMHDEYELVVEDVFTVKRSGEESRYEPFKELPNRKLLWHGSDVTNFVGILSQGLRIPPPEATPSNGAMFGKGIYFADMVSKSANYSNEKSAKTTGLVLLCEVALGNICELLEAASTTVKAPDGYHSVWGRGRVTQPDPEKSVKLEDGVEVPCGPLILSEIQKSQLLHNEFIVYDEAQVKIKYIVKLKFQYRNVREN